MGAKYQRELELASLGEEWLTKDRLTSGSHSNSYTMPATPAVIMWVSTFLDFKFRGFGNLDKIVITTQGKSQILYYLARVCWGGFQAKIRHFEDLSTGRDGSWGNRREFQDRTNRNLRVQRDREYLLKRLQEIGTDDFDDYLRLCEKQRKPDAILVSTLLSSVENCLSWCHWCTGPSMDRVKQALIKDLDVLRTGVLLPKYIELIRREKWAEAAQRWVENGDEHESPPVVLYSPPDPNANLTDSEFLEQYAKKLSIE